MADPHSDSDFPSEQGFVPRPSRRSQPLIGYISSSSPRPNPIHHRDVWTLLALSLRSPPYPLVRFSSPPDRVGCGRARESESMAGGTFIAPSSPRLPCRHLAEKEAM